MQIRIANAPTSWGVEDPEDGANPRWERLLSDIAEAGYDGTELGPLGYLPGDPTTLRVELAERELELVGGYVFEALHTPEGATRALEVGRATCELLAAAGAVHLVIIQGFSTDREGAAGRPGVTPPLAGDEWATLVESVERLARLATEDHGLIPVFHPHAGTHV